MTRVSETSIPTWSWVPWVAGHVVSHHQYDVTINRTHKFKRCILTNIIHVTRLLIILFGGKKERVRYSYLSGIPSLLTLRYMERTLAI